MPDPGAPRGLVVDWGGVLTAPIRTAVESWADRDGIDLTHYGDIIRAWLGPEAEIEAAMNPIHALERGEVEVPHFEERLAAELSRRSGRTVESAGLLERMFAHFEHAHDMNALVRRARGHGIRTALLSNSWGDYYPRHLWDGMFDEVVISHEVGMRKPEPRIFELTLQRLRLEPGEVAFVDDLPVNIAAGAELGIIGVLHQSYDQTRLELEALFGVDLD